LPAELTSIEHIDLTGSGNNTLTSDPQAFFDITEERGVGVPALAVDGNAGDVVQMAIGGGAWSQVGSTVVGSTTYDRWVWDPDGAGPHPATLNAELWLDTDLTASFI